MHQYRIKPLNVKRLNDPGNEEEEVEGKESNLRGDEQV